MTTIPDHPDSPRISADPLIDEVRAARAALWARFDNDPSRVFAFVRRDEERIEREQPGRVVTRPVERNLRLWRVG